jgi:hypothetical protein
MAWFCWHKWKFLRASAGGIYYFYGCKKCGKIKDCEFKWPATMNTEEIIALIKDAEDRAKGD